MFASFFASQHPIPDNKSHFSAAYLQTVAKVIHPAGIYTDVALSMQVSAIF